MFQSQSHNLTFVESRILNGLVSVLMCGGFGVSSASAVEITFSIDFFSLQLEIDYDVAKMR